MPSKNIRPLLGKPLIAHTIGQALECKLIERVVVSTDSQEIADIAIRYGAEVPFLRPADLATDAAPKLPVLQHAVRYNIDTGGYVPDYVIDLDPTSPLRHQEDIEKCLNTIINDNECDSVVTGYRSNKNPYFNMVELSPEGYARLSKTSDNPIAGRQGAPPVYAMNASIYVWRTAALLNQASVVTGRVRFVEMPEMRSIDIDSEVDFKLVELLMKEAKR